MINFICPIVPGAAAALPSHNEGSGTNRSVFLSNMSAEIVYLLFDGSNQSTLTILSGYQLPAKTSIRIGSDSPGGQDGCFPVWAVSASGLAVLNIQTISSRKILP